MYLAPAVSWDVRPSRWQAQALALLVVLGTVAVAAYLLLQPLNARALVLLAASIGSMVFAIFGHQKAFVGTLRWDGEQWHWSGMEHQAVRRLSCALDFQRMLLLRIEGATGEMDWLWLHSDGMNPRWLAFRRAVVSGRAGVEPSVSSS